MKRSTLKIFVILALLSIVGIVITQLFWFKKAYENNEQEFDQNCNIALKETVKDILKYNNRANFPIDPVVKLRSNYFAIMVNDQIDGLVLAHYLQLEFKRFNINQGFEYSIYDCANKKIVYGGYIEGSGAYQPTAAKNLPEYKTDNYYFTVYFPHKKNNIIAAMSLWIYSSGILLLVVLFFSYSLFVILKQKRLSEIQKDFINNMAHEIRTPLSTIKISANTLKEPSIIQNPQRLLSYATIIADEANRLTIQVERVLSIAENEHKIKLKLENVDIHPIIEKISNQFSSNSNKKIKLQLDLAAKNSILFGDPIHLANVVSNLIDNAIKYSEEEEVSITISTQNDNANKLSISVTDNGIGISKENQKRIFTSFFRVPTGNIHSVKGFGIGLNYVSLIVKAHKGSIELKSELEKGSTFILHFPLL